MLYDEKIIREIAEEVLSRLNEGAAAVAKRVMMVITGGTVGANSALEELVRLKERKGNGLEYVVLFSRAAAEIHRPEEIGEKLKATEVLVEGKDTRGKATSALKRCDLVAVPVLTRTTASRLASLLLDTAASEVLVDALMRGIPVVAARDAADPLNDGYRRLNMNRGKPPLIRAMTGNLDKIAGYGINLVEAHRIGQVLEQAIWAADVPEDPPPAESATVNGPFYRSVMLVPQVFIPAGEAVGSPGDRWQPGQRAVVTRSDLAHLVDADGMVRVPRGTLITPLANDIIRDAGWQVKEI